MKPTDELMSTYTQKLIKLRYSKGSVQGYSSCVKSFLGWLKKSRPEKTPLCLESIQEYIRHILLIGRSRSYCDMLISAMKVMHVQVYNVDRSQIENMRKLIDEVEKENAATPPA